MKTQSFGKQLFKAIKNLTKANSPHLVLSVGSPIRAVLRPVSTLPGHLDLKDIRLLTEWRNRHVKSFLTEFDATDDQTADWLSSSVHQNDGKMLFMVDTLDGQSVGHVGLGFIDWNILYGEADAIVSGGSSPPGLMKASLLALMDWAKEVLGLNTLAVRVRSDNSALEFYRKVGFREISRVPITPQLTTAGVDWVESKIGTESPVALVYMTLDLQKNLVVA